MQRYRYTLYLNMLYVIWERTQLTDKERKNTFKTFSNNHIASDKTKIKSDETMANVKYARPIDTL